MDSQQLRSLLERVQRGDVQIDDAMASIHSQPADDLPFANVDHQRALRCGFPEVVFGLGKTADQIHAIIGRVLAAGAGCLTTRVDHATAELLSRAYPGGRHDAVARTFWVPPESPEPPQGRVAVVSAGTSDLPVAREAFVTAEAMGVETTLIVDVGVAGLHRILARQAELAKQDAVVVVAGMEGALPSVVGGLVACPVIAVPTSVGYGAAFGGVAALLGMLNSCAANVVAVNIDAGFCGGYVAGLIARRARQPEGSASRIDA